MKPTHIEFRSARFNRKNPAEQRVIEIIEQYEAQGTSFKQLAMVAILQHEGVDLTPYLVPAQQHGQGLSEDEMTKLLETTLAAQLEHYTDELLRQLKKNRGGDSSRQYDDVDREEISETSRNFARGVVQRHNKSVGSGDE